MAGRFSYSRPERRRATDPWFRIGEVDIGSAAFLAILCAVSVLVYGIGDAGKRFLLRLALIPDDVWSGQVWRLVTWPLANGFDQRLLWTAVAIALLWYFGSRLEEQIGRVRMTVLLIALIILPGIVGALLDLPQAGIRSIEIAVLRATFIIHARGTRPSPSTGADRHALISVSCTTSSARDRSPPIDSANRYTTAACWSIAARSSSGAMRGRS